MRGRNEILRLCSSIPAHPLPVLLNNGIPLSLNSDDLAVFNTMGLSYDFYQALVSSEISGLSTLAQLALDSLQVGFTRCTVSVLGSLSSSTLYCRMSRRSKPLLHGRGGSRNL